MTLVFITGGARSGKSRLALEIAGHQSAPVTFLATAEALDGEMAHRIARHRAERPAHWHTVEEPLHLGPAIESVPDEQCLVVDCLSLWVANAMARGEAIDGAVELASRRPGLTIAVSNEVGMGIVPGTPMGREYRDVLGHVNAAWARAADHALLAVAGRALVLRDAGEVVAALGR